MFCRHKWAWHSYRPIEVYGDGFGNMTKLPTKFQTELIGQCSKCGKPRVKTIKGQWHPRKRGDV